MFITSCFSCRFLYLVICGVIFVRGQELEGDNCTVDNNNGTCTLISSCSSVVKNLSELGLKPEICGYKGIVPIVCCFDETDGNETSTAEETQNDKQKKKNREFIRYSENLVNNTGETTGMKAHQKCIEYSELIYEWKLPENETDPDKKVKINNCAHIAAPLFIGSEIASIREFPHMALLGFRNKKHERVWLCAGILISEEYVLTAGHCADSGGSRNGKVRWVRLGEQSIDLALESEIQDFAVEQIIVHPGYKRPLLYYDIALIQLDRKATLNKFVIPACLHVGYEIKEKNVIATGWGAPGTGQKGRLDLAKRILELFPYEECNQVYETTSDVLRFGIQDGIMICEGHRSEEQGSCRGDSGGPVQVYMRKPYCMYDIVGITSFGKGCNIPGVPGISTRISAYISWIESIVWPD